MATKISISEQKSQLKRLELDAKDQKVLIAQYVQHINNQVEKYTVKNQRGKFFNDLRGFCSQIIRIFLFFKNLRINQKISHS